MGIVKVKPIYQQGPTCGIYALAMIVNSLYEGRLNIKNNKNIKEQNLASDIFDLAVDNNLSVIGELFDIDNVRKLLDLINASALIKGKEKLIYSIIDFNTLDEMTEKMKKALNEDMYILIAFYNKNGQVYPCNGKKNMKETHWGVFYRINDGKLYGEQALERPSKNGVLQGVEIEELFKANICLDEDFSWAKYLFLKKSISMNNINGYIKERIDNILKNNYKEIKKGISKLNVKGKMIIIGRK